MMMAVSYFAVEFVPGPGWDRALDRRAQIGWPEHAAFMDALVTEGFVLLGGPVGSDDRVLLAVRAASEAAIIERFAADPWEADRVIEIASIEPWSLWLGAPE
jgi:uncharacterized protein YciI